MILVSNTISDKHAVVFPLQNTSIANAAVPGSRWGDRFTHSTQFPLATLQSKPVFYQFASI